MIPFIGLFPAWWKLAAVGMVAVALAGGAWKLRHSGVTAGRAEIQTQWNAERLAASENARLREQAAQKSNERVDREYQTAKTRLAADSRANSDKLRDLQATLKPADSIASTTSSLDDPRDAIIDQCATVVVELDRYAKGVALTASGLQEYAREVCMSK